MGQRGGGERERAKERGQQTRYSRRGSLVIRDSLDDGTKHRASPWGPRRGRSFKVAKVRCQCVYGVGLGAWCLVHRGAVVLGACYCRCYLRYGRWGGRSMADFPGWRTCESTCQVQKRYLGRYPSPCTGSTSLRRVTDHHHQVSPKVSVLRRQARSSSAKTARSTRIAIFETRPARATGHWARPQDQGLRWFLLLFLVILALALACHYRPVCVGIGQVCERTLR